MSLAKPRRLHAVGFALRGMQARQESIESFQAALVDDQLQRIGRRAGLASNAPKVGERIAIARGLAADQGAAWRQHRPGEQEPAGEFLARHYLAEPVRRESKQQAHGKPVDAPRAERQ
jgi:hypothetical protein